MAANGSRTAALLPPVPLPLALATRADVVPMGRQWLHERKLDGYRIQCHVDGRRATLFSRNGLDWSDRFPAITAALLQVARRKRMVADGEIVMPAVRDGSGFQALQGAVRDGKTTRAIYWLFDLLQWDALDLRALPLSGRRDALSAVLARSEGTARVRMTRELRGSASKLLATACAAGEEGVISKLRDAPYRSGRSRDWLKIKCAQADEFVVVGYTAPRGSRSHLGALLLATREPDGGVLRYVGRVGSGMSDETLRALQAGLIPRRTAPVPEVAALAATGVRWVEPRTIVGVSFAEWTADGLLRQATFRGVREDKLPTDIQRETTVPVNEITLTHPERVVYPENGVTKRAIADYYEAAAPLMLPHVRGRPLSLLRCPDGAHASCFFQKHWPRARNSAISTCLIREADGSSDPYAVIDSAGDLLRLVQMNVIEFHAWGAHFPDIAKPDRIVIDLDPGPGVAWPEVCDAARTVRDLLHRIELDSWVKLTGGKGLHLTIPVAGGVTWEQLSGFARLIALRMTADEPHRFTAKAAKVLRPKRIFIDWMRNARGATAVVPWSLRARPGAPIAMPISWDDLVSVTSGDQMTIPEVIDYLRSAPDDPWSDLQASTQRLTSATVQSLGDGLA